MEEKLLSIVCPVKDGFVLSALNNIKFIFYLTKKQFVCKYHPHRKLKYYCVGCDKKICSICKAGFFEYNEKIEIQQNKVIQNFDTINISNGIITPFTSVADTSDNKEVRHYHQFKDIELEKLKSQDHDLLQQFEEVSNKIIKYLPNKTNKREFIQFQKENEPIRDKIKERNDTIEYVLMNVLLYKFLSLMKNLYLTTKHLNICNVLLNFKRNFRINSYYISNTNNSLSQYLVPQNMVITLEKLTTYEAEKEIKVILLLKTGKKVIIILEFLFVYAKI